MFGLSWDQIILILLAALFLLGPERIPVAIRWLMDSLRKLRTMAAGAQDEMRAQLGTELDELRRQVAELQSLKEWGELRALRDLDPRRMVGKGLLGDEFSGGLSGFLGLTDQPGQSAGAGSSGGSATQASETSATGAQQTSADPAPQPTAEAPASGRSDPGETAAARGTSASGSPAPVDMPTADDALPKASASSTVGNEPAAGTVLFDDEGT